MKEVGSRRIVVVHLISGTILFAFHSEEWVSSKFPSELMVPFNHSRACDSVFRSTFYF